MAFNNWYEYYLTSGTTRIANKYVTIPSFSGSTSLKWAAGTEGENCGNIRTSVTFGGEWRIQTTGTSGDYPVQLLFNNVNTVSKTINYDSSRLGYRLRCATTNVRYRFKYRSSTASTSESVSSWMSVPDSTERSTLYNISRPSYVSANRDFFIELEGEIDLRVGFFPIVATSGNNVYVSATVGSMDLIKYRESLTASLWKDEFCAIVKIGIFSGSSSPSTATALSTSYNGINININYSKTGIYEIDTLTKNSTLKNILINESCFSSNTTYSSITYDVSKSASTQVIAHEMFGTRYQFTENMKTKQIVRTKTSWLNFYYGSIQQCTITKSGYDFFKYSGQTNGCKSEYFMPKGGFPENTISHTGVDHIDSIIFYMMPSIYYQEFYLALCYNNLNTVTGIPLSGMTEQAQRTCILPDAVSGCTALNSNGFNFPGFGYLKLNMQHNNISYLITGATISNVATVERYNTLKYPGYKGTFALLKYSGTTIAYIQTINPVSYPTTSYNFVKVYNIKEKNEYGGRIITKQVNFTFEYNPTKKTKAVDVVGLSKHLYGLYSYSALANPTTATTFNQCYNTMHQGVFAQSIKKYRRNLSVEANNVPTQYNTYNGTLYYYKFFMVYNNTGIKYQGEVIIVKITSNDDLSYLPTGYGIQLGDNVVWTKNQFTTAQWNIFIGNSSGYLILSPTIKPAYVTTAWGYIRTNDAGTHFNMYTISDDAIDGNRQVSNLFRECFGTALSEDALFTNNIGIYGGRKGKRLLYRDLDACCNDV